MPPRPRLPSTTPLQYRTVVHHARPPRVPVIPSPFTPAPTRGTEGTRVPRPRATTAPLPFTPAAPASAPLPGTPGLTIHHAPPPTAPSYTNGTEPALLRWIRGEAVELSGEEAAPLRRKAKVGGEGRPFDDEMVQRIVGLRKEGMSRGEVAKALNIPRDLQHLIPRAAPASRAARAATAAADAAERATWSFKKRLARDVRERRKDFW